MLLVAAQYTPSVGGSETQSRVLARAWRAAGVDVAVWTRRLDRAHERIGTVDQIPVRRLGSVFRLKTPIVRSFERLTFLAALHRELHRASFDVVFANQPQPHAVVAAMARGSRAPLVVRTATSGPLSEFRRGEAMYRAYRAVLRRRAARIVALGPSIRTECVDAGFDPSRVVVIPNGVESVPPIARRFDGARYDAVWIGRFRPEKRADLAILAWHEAGLGGAFRIFGDGPTLGLAQAALDASSQAQAGPCELAGPTLDPARELGRAEVFVQSSEAEGMSNALLEAMMSGCACIATDVGETRSVLSGEDAAAPRPGGFVEAKAGLLVLPGDQAGLANALRALQDPSLRERLSRTAREKALGSFAIAVVRGRYLDLFKDAMNEAPAR